MVILVVADRVQSTEQAPENIPFRLAQTRISILTVKFITNWQVKSTENSLNSKKS